MREEVGCVALHKVQQRCINHIRISLENSFVLLRYYNIFENEHAFGLA